MADRVARCSCGQMPTFVACATAEDYVTSQFVCQTGFRLPGGGMSRKGCGKQGSGAEDSYSDRATALSLWNAMIRREAGASATARPQALGQSPKRAEDDCAEAQS